MKMKQKRNAVGRDDFELLSEKEKKGKLIHSWLPWGLHIIQTKTTEGFIGNWNREMPLEWASTVKKSFIYLKDNSQEYHSQTMHWMQQR